MIEVTTEMLYAVMASWVGIIFIVLKYGPLKTKILYLAWSGLLLGLFVFRFIRTMGVLLISVSSLILAVYFAKGLRDLISEF